LAVKGVVLADQVKSLDWRVRRASHACTVPDGVLDETVARLLALVDPS
jgi:mRNA interferase MazF